MFICHILCEITNKVNYLGSKFFCSLKTTIDVNRQTSMNLVHRLEPPNCHIIDNQILLTQNQIKIPNVSYRRPTSVGCIAVIEKLLYQTQMGHLSCEEKEQKTSNINFRACCRPSWTITMPIQVINFY